MRKVCDRIDRAKSAHGKCKRAPRRAGVHTCEYASVYTYVYIYIYVGEDAGTVSVPFTFPSERENEKAGKSTLFIDCHDELNEIEGRVKTLFFSDKQVSFNNTWDCKEQKPTLIKNR